MFVYWIFFWCIYLFFLPYCWLLEHSLTFHFDLPVVFLSKSFYIVHLVVALRVTLFVHSFSRSTGIVILPVHKV
jgi:hypothetical protein